MKEEELNIPVKALNKIMDALPQLPNANIYNQVVVCYIDNGLKELLFKKNSSGLEWIFVGFNEKPQKGSDLREKIRNY